MADVEQDGKFVLPIVCLLLWRNCSLHPAEPTPAPESTGAPRDVVNSNRVGPESSHQNPAVETSPSAYVSYGGGNKNVFASPPCCYNCCRRRVATHNYAVGCFFLCAAKCACRWPSANFWLAELSRAPPTHALDICASGGGTWGKPPEGARGLVKLVRTRHAVGGGVDGAQSGSKLSSPLIYSSQTTFRNRSE